MQEKGGSCCINQANNEVQKKGCNDNGPAYGFYGVSSFGVGGGGGVSFPFALFSLYSHFRKSMKASFACLGILRCWVNEVEVSPYSVISWKRHVAKEEFK